MAQDTDSVIDVVAAALRVPFPKSAVQQREGGGGKQLDYISVDTAIRRVLSATGGRYSFRVIPEGSSFYPAGANKYGKEEYLHVVLGEVTIPGLGSWQAYGVQRITLDGGKSDDLMKAAAGDAFKKCLTYAGVALELYGPDREAGEPQREQTPPRSRVPQGYKAMETDPFA